MQVVTENSLVFNGKDYPEALVNLKSIPGLSYIREDGGQLKIGALTRLEERIAENAKVEKVQSISRKNLSIVFVFLDERVKERGKELDRRHNAVDVYLETCATVGALPRAELKHQMVAQPRKTFRLGDAQLRGVFPSDGGQLGQSEVAGLDQRAFELRRIRPLRT